LALAGILALAGMIARLAIRLALAGIQAIAMDRTILGGREGGCGAYGSQSEEGGGRGQRDSLDVVHGNVSVWLCRRISAWLPSCSVPIDRELHCDSENQICNTVTGMRHAGGAVIWRLTEASDAESSNMTLPSRSPTPSCAN